MGSARGRLLAAAVAACPGYSACPGLDYPALMQSSPGEAAARTRIETVETASLGALDNPKLRFGQLLAYLGQAIVFDSSLSARRNEACAFCHDPRQGFAAGPAEFAAGGGIVPGSVASRVGFHTPLPLAYAPFAPKLQYREQTRDFAGGNFWDGRATGAVTGSPAADQPITPLTSPFEMALPDPACAVWRVSQAPYGAQFARLWGTASLNFAWPEETETTCSKPKSGGRAQMTLRLSPADRARVPRTVGQIGQTIAAFEESWLASPFKSRFDAVLAAQEKFTPQEARGYALFTGRAKCATCHSTAGARPLLTDFSFANLGVPRNPSLAYLAENKPDTAGYIANAAGAAFTDLGLGGFLASDTHVPAEWQAQAARFAGAFQVPTLRNVSKRADDAPMMHNGSLKGLRMVVHFLNTRDVLPRCQGEAGLGMTCWPAPEVSSGVDKARTGNLRLSAGEEDDLVAFLATLTDRG